MQLYLKVKTMCLGFIYLSWYFQIKEKMAKKFKKPIIDWIQFDSWEEWEIYQHLKNWTIVKATGIEGLKWYKLIDARPKWITLFKWFKAGGHTQRARSYKRDFTLKKWDDIMHLEYKSKWSEGKPDYRLRRFLVLLNWTLNFAELTKIKKWVYKFKKYY